MFLTTLVGAGAARATEAKAAADTTENFMIMV